MGGQNSVTTNKQNNKQQRTPSTIIIARQDSFRILGLKILTLLLYSETYTLKHPLRGKFPFEEKSVLR